MRLVIEPLSTSITTKSALGVPAQPMSELGVYTPAIALGISKKGWDDYVLAVRLQRRALEGSPQLEAIKKQAKGELDVRYIGRVTKLAAKARHQQRNRPLRMGGSVGHFKVTAGTLGCFVRAASDGPFMLLSNNHVLADESRGKKGQDAILQPGPIDAGRNPEDRVATLSDFIRLNKTKPNLVDCAVAELDEGIEFNARRLEGLGNLSGLGDAELDGAVAKVGRTTGTTHGRIRAFDVSYLIVEDYRQGKLRFDEQIEIESQGPGPFSRAGDSGVLIVDKDVLGVGLLFSTSDLGGTNGLGLTYANPLRTVLDLLKASLVLQ